MKLLKLFVRILSFISPVLAARFSFWLFQRTPGKKNRFRKRELSFYSAASHFKVSHSREELNCYEMGTPSNKMAVLIHGWESNAGSLNNIGSLLVNLGYHVVSIDLPGHGKSELLSTNLVDSSEALKSFFMRIRPDKNTLMITHSFGSLVAAQALSSTFHQIGNWVMLTSPNKVTDIFKDYKSMIGLSDKAYELLCRQAEKLLNEPITAVAVETKLHTIDYMNLLIIHDIKDKVIPVDYSRNINLHHQNSHLIEFSGLGHYRMLTNEKVLIAIEQFLTTSSLSKVVANEDKLQNIQQLN